MTQRQLASARMILLLVLCGAVVGCGSSSSPGGGTITSVAVSCFNTVLQAGQSDQCSATVQGTGNFSSAVNWTASAGSVSSAGLFTDASASGSVTVTATSAADSTKSGWAKVTVNAAQKSNFTYSGITHVSWSQGEYSSTAGTTSQDALAASGANWAGVLVTWYQANATSTTIAAANNTPTDTDVIAAITELHNKGLKVMLKPHVDALDGSWRGTFQPSDINAWFNSFTSFILHYAALAQSNGVEMFCFGTEYKDLTNANLSKWTTVINLIRGIYTIGKLTYAANATGSGDEFTSVVFWKQVDVIGLDAYVPLTDHADPTLAELVSAWSNNRYGDNFVAAVTTFKGAYPSMPIIFTEIGYRSVAGTNEAPYDFTMTGAVDGIEQQNCYEAMYEVWSAIPTVMSGNFWWAWAVPPPSSTDTDYTPWNKPAETLLHAWQ
jgi:glycosyl hydrolase family 113/Big-like domain-containing protein